MKAVFMGCLLFCTQVSAECNIENQTEYLAKTMFYEARGEGLDAMQMVGETVLARVESDDFPDTICEVIFQKSQFHSTTSFNNTISKEENKLWEQAKIIADDLISGEIEYFNTGATYFLNLGTIGYTPKWAKKLDPVGKYGSHTFYAENDTKEKIYFD